MTFVRDINVCTDPAVGSLCTRVVVTGMDGSHFEASCMDMGQADALYQQTRQGQLTMDRAREALGVPPYRPEEDIFAEYRAEVVMDEPFSLNRHMSPHVVVDRVHTFRFESGAEEVVRNENLARHLARVLAAGPHAPERSSGLRRPNNISRRTFWDVVVEWDVWLHRQTESIATGDSEPRLIQGTINRLLSLDLRRGFNRDMVALVLDAQDRLLNQVFLEQGVRQFMREVDVAAEKVHIVAASDRDAMNLRIGEVWRGRYRRPLVHDGERDLHLESPFDSEGIRHDDGILRATDLSLRHT